ncbi:MAG: class I SAM-dependent methyltransferase [Luteolibacter sp.]
MEVGSPEFFSLQKSLIERRPLLKRCYDDWYSRLLADVRSAPEPGLLLELGSGGSCLKELEPAFITSDVVPDVAERVIDACELPFDDSSIRAIALTHVLHHIPEVEAFFREATRTLKPGGVITMIEVAHTPFARFFFRNFHPEPYDDARKEWGFSQQDSMMDSNQALSWMVFVRDRPRFEKLFPELILEEFSFTPWFSYLISGGVTKRDLIPHVLVPCLAGMEWLLTPLRPVFALHWHIRIRRKI